MSLLTRYSRSSFAVNSGLLRAKVEDPIVYPPLLNAWVDFDVSSKTFYKKVGKVVNASVWVKSGVNASEIFTLPVGYRPVNDVITVALINLSQVSGYVNFTSAGGVFFFSTLTPINSVFCNVTFSVP